MYNLRYHVISLVAVFLALAVGLILGGAIVHSGTVESSSATMVKSLQSEFNKTRTANRQLSSDVDHQSSLSNYLAQQWAAGRLDGDSVLVLVTSDTKDGLEETQDAIKAGGGTPVLLTITKPITPSVVSKLETTLSVGADASDAQINTALAKTIATELQSAKAQRSTLNSLIDEGYIAYDGPDDQTLFSGVIDLATRSKKADQFAIALSSQFMSTGRPAVAAQLHTSDTNLITEAEKADLSTLDTLEGAYGTEGIVALFSGAPAGNYGVDQKQANWFPQVSSN